MIDETSTNHRRWPYPIGRARPVSPEFVRRIEDDVVLDVERDEEVQEGAS